MTQTNNTQVDDHVGGVSLASFLQMLEQERKSCTLKVSSGDITGRLFFKTGNLIDAECEDAVGREAVYRLLRLNNPGFNITDPEDRLHRIRQPLSHILLDTTARIDEEKHEENARKVPDKMEQAIHEQANPVIKRLIETIVDIAGIKHYFILNRQGRIISQSSTNQKIGDFITYCIISGIQIRKILDVKGPHRIRLEMENHEILLILPGAGMILGLLLNEHASVTDIVARVRPALTTK